MNYQIVYSDSPSELTLSVNKLMKEGWEPVGSHQVAETFHQNKFSGMDHMGTSIAREYTQTMIKNKDMYNLDYPNKVFVADFSHDGDFGKSKHTIIIAAKDEKTAQHHLNNLFGIKPELTWLMNTGHLTINDQVGKPLPIQVKVLFNTHSKEV